MRRILCAVLCLALILSLCACSKAPEAAPEQPEPQAAEKPEKAETKPSEEEPEKDEPVIAPDTSGEDISPEDVEEIIEDAAWDEMEAIGKIKTENGVLYSYITLPAELSEGATQELLDESAGEIYTSAVLNDDGSITYKLTKKQHKNMMDSMKTVIDEVFGELIKSDDYAYTKIVPNSTYTEFDVTLNTEELGLVETYMNVIFYLYGGLYGVFYGREADTFIVNYYRTDGSLITSVNSAEQA